MRKLRCAPLALAAALALGLPGAARAQQSAPTYHYAGFVRGKSVPDRLVRVETHHGFLDFFYLPAESKCVDLKALKVGDAVEVTSSTGRAPFKASCVERVTVPR